MDDRDTIFVFDGYGLIYRAYFIFINKPLTDKDGNNVSAIHGFFQTLSSLIRKHKISYAVVAMDRKGPTFRHKMFPEYKANRDKAPEDLHSQVPFIEKILNLLGITVIGVQGFEADDVMGTIAQICRDTGKKCRLVSADKDLMQLIGDGVTLIRPQTGGGFREFDSEEVLEEKGIHPNQMIDYLSLIGDKSDNIPGVKGIGEKTACRLLSQWDNLDNIYANLENAASGAQLDKLKNGKENAYFSRDLITIKTDLDIAEALETLKKGSFRSQQASDLFFERGMRRLAEEFEESSVERESLPTVQVERKTNYSAILTESDMNQWGEKIKHSGIVAVDTETDNIDPLRANLVGISFSIASAEAAYLPLSLPSGTVLPREKVIEWLNEIFHDENLRIVGQNFKYDLKVFQRAGVRVKRAWFDTMICAFMLDPSSPVGMDALSLRYLGIPTVKFKDVVPKGSTFADVPLEEALRYAAEDADITWCLYEVLNEKLQANKTLAGFFRNVNMPVQEILVDMETQGINMNTEELKQYGKELDESIRFLVQEIYNLCGHEFNIASPKQLQEVLFKERGLTPLKKIKTGFSTDNSVLSALAVEDPVPEKVLIYRSLSKIKSTYVDVLPKFIHPEDGCIHTTFSQTIAATGRLSSNNPNLQNIPIRDENGRRIREAFKSEPGYTFVSADYSQIELVVLAHMSGDEELSKAFQEGVDVHARTAALLYSVDTDEVTSSQRHMAKTVNFGVMYGMSAFRLANEMKISNKEAKHFIESYFTTYRDIKSFVEKSVKLAEEEGGSRTLYGCFRPLPGIKSRNRIEKAAAERAAVNSRIQGTAADIMKKAMIAVHKNLTSLYPDSRMLLQVHDELLLEVPDADVLEVFTMLKDTMENAVKLSVPLSVGVETGKSWGEFH